MLEVILEAMHELDCEPLYLLTGRNFEDHEASYDIDVCAVDEATTAILASEPLTEDTDDWLEIEFGQIVFLEKQGSNITRTVGRLNASA